MARSKLVVSLVVIVVLFAAIGAVVAISAIVSEPRSRTPPLVAVAKEDGELRLYACVPTGLGSAVVAEGSALDSPTIWSAVLSSGPAAQRIPIGAIAPGYSIEGVAIPTGSVGVLTLHDVTDSAGNPLLVTVLEFVPAELAEGDAITSDGRTQSIESFEESAGCE